MHATTSYSLLGKRGKCGRKDCDLERRRIEAGRSGFSRFCEAHTCMWPDGMPGLRHNCLEKKAASRLVCNHHLRAHYEHEAQKELQRQERERELRAHTRQLCTRTGCTQPRHGSYGLCTLHMGLCTFRECGIQQLDGTERCEWHQSCSYHGCDKLALIMCRWGPYDRIEVHEYTGFCEEHKACDSRTFTQDGSQAKCKVPILKKETACQEHRCITAGCKEKREVGANEQNLRCQLHTCRVQGCKEPTPNSATERRYKFCEEHTCAEPLCFAEVRDGGFAFCERHIYENSVESPSTSSDTDDDVRSPDRRPLNRRSPGLRRREGGPPPTPVAPHGLWEEDDLCQDFNREERRRRRRAEARELDELRGSIRGLRIGSPPPRSQQGFGHRAARREAYLTPESSTETDESRRSLRRRLRRALDRDQVRR